MQFLLRHLNTAGLKTYDGYVFSIDDEEAKYADEHHVEKPKIEEKPKL